VREKSEVDVPIPRERYRDGLSWEQWLDRVGDQCREWVARHHRAALGSLRADYQEFDGTRYVACLMGPGAELDAEALDTLPWIVKACEQAGEGQGVDVRILPWDDAGDLRRQYAPADTSSGPVCVVMDQDWVQLGFWEPRPPTSPRALEAGAPEGERQEARELLCELLQVLQGLPVPAWRATRAESKHLQTQANVARTGHPR
jgi:hypothetical protein